MKWTANTGKRPSGLNDNDKVYVRLRSGRELGPWTVSNRTGSMRWNLLPEGDLCRDADVMDWRPA